MGSIIKSLDVSNASQVARLHIKGIPTGFISSLGQEFVSALYEAIAEDKNSFGFVAVEDDKVLGFVAFSINLSRLYKYVALKKGFRFAFVLANRMLSLRVIKKVWDNLFYPAKMKKMDLPDAELLSIAVAPEGRGRGIAKQLVDAGFEECRKRKIEKVKVLVAADNEVANKLYKKCGFEFKIQIDSHSVSSNIYVRDLK
ncbi:MAG: GNAT family N-acetyltransferase [Phycisphaerae bacterium]|jgi:ribosomal protein S18 acetylase RimI-like enzyme